VLSFSYQTHTTSRGCSFPSTYLVERATHIVVASDCTNENLSLRSLPPPQRVVTIEWLRDRTLRRGESELERLEAEAEIQEAEEELDELEEEQEPVEEPDNTWL